jgi:phosphoglycolate phosphatase
MNATHESETLVLVAAAHVGSRRLGVRQVRLPGNHCSTADHAAALVGGDTLRDVQAGLRGGARVIAVATATDSEQALLNEGADIVLPDLRDTRAVTKALAGIAA